MSKKFEWACPHQGCDRYIMIEMSDHPTGDRQRALEETEQAFARRVKAHLSTHANIGYRPAEIPAGRRLPGPDEVE